MNQDYFDTVGQNMIAGFLDYTPDDFELHIYAENITTDITVDYRIKYFDWNKACYNNWLSFSKKTKDTKSIKFAKKGFAFLHAMENTTAKYLIWVDADIEFLKKITNKIINKTINNKLIGIFDHSYLGSTGYSAESGYVILNTSHKYYKDFVNTYRYYFTLDGKPAEIEKWYDGQVCMLAASKFKNDIFNLSLLAYNKDTHTPLNYCLLNEYMIHHKGPRAKRYIRNTT